MGRRRVASATPLEQATRRGWADEARRLGLSAAAAYWRWVALDRAQNEGHALFWLREPSATDEPPEA